MKNGYFKSGFHCNLGIETSFCLNNYRVAKKMVESKESKSAPAVTRQLLENCLKLLDMNAFPYLYESALIMLAEVSLFANKCQLLRY